MIKKYGETFAKYAGFATVCVEWLSLLLYYLWMPAYFGGKYPISYFDTLPQTRLVFTSCYTLAGIFFWIFIRYNIHKRFPAPLKIIGLSLILFVGMALVPFNPDNHASNLIHSTLGLSSAILFVIGLSIMSVKAKNHAVHLVTVSAVIASLVLFLAFLIFPKSSNLTFAFEAGSWLVWQLWVIWISFYSLKYPLHT